jgi:spermidine synthase
MERWIAETFNADWRPTIRADKILFEEKSDHQDIVIFENAFWGRVLILDGVFQLTTRDEFIYHEMMAHVPLITLNRPRKVLIIGGGDGGVLREVLKHPSVEEATLVEIDQSVIDTALKYFPAVGKKAFADKRSNVVIADGRKFVGETNERYDVVIVDSSEPIGPSAVLHTKAFFADCKRVLRDGGIMTTQSSLPFHSPKHLQTTTRALSQIFADAEPYVFTHPCYFGGEFTAVWGSDNAALRRQPLATIAGRSKRRGHKTRYWTPEIQLATFMLPGYIRAIADKAKG